MQYLASHRLLALLLAVTAALAFAHGASAQVFTPTAQACASAGLYGTAAAGTQVSCTVNAPNTLGTSAIIMATPTIPTPSPSLQCRGLSVGYTTQGFVSQAAPNASAPYASVAGCTFQVTSGTVPANAPLGTAIVTLSEPVSAGALQFNLAFCTDLTCGVAELQNAPPYTSFAGTNYCLSIGCGSLVTPPSPPQFTAATAGTPYCSGTGCGGVLVPPSTPQGAYASTASCYGYSCATLLSPPAQPQGISNLSGGFSCTPFGSGYYCHQ